MSVTSSVSGAQKRGGEPSHAQSAMSSVARGDILESPALGLRAEVLDSNRSLFRADVRALAGGNGGPLHRHLRSEERFLVHQGTLRVRDGFRRSRLVGSGEEVAIRAGRPHTFSVVSEAAHFTAEFRPAWEIAEVFRDIFALSVSRLGTSRATDLAVLIGRYPDDFFYSAFVPPALHRAIARLLVRRGPSKQP